MLVCLIRTSPGANDVRVVKSAVSQRSVSALSLSLSSQSTGSVCALHCTSYVAPISVLFFASFYTFLVVLKSLPLWTTRWHRSPIFLLSAETKAKFSTTRFLNNLVMGDV